MVYQFPTEPALPSEALPSLDGDLVIKALEKQFDAARVRRVAAGTESTRRWAGLGYAWLRLADLKRSVNPVKHPTLSPTVDYCGRFV